MDAKNFRLSNSQSRALSGEIAFDLPLRHQIVLAEKTTHFPIVLLNETD